VIIVLSRSLTWLCDNAEPLAVDAGGPYDGVAGDSIVLSSMVTGGIPPYITCRWDFGDGYIYEGLEVSHVYDDPGEYTITVTVTDSAYPFTVVSSETTAFIGVN